MRISRRPPFLSLLLCAALLAGGCRVFRGHKVSDESLAAARQLSLQGIDAQQRGQWQRAENLFAAAILKCPSDERARCGYAESLWNRGAADQAVVHMEEAVRLSGDDPERAVRLGQMYRARGDLARAGRQADAALSVNPHLAKAWALRGSVLQAQGNHAEALASYHRALSYEHPLPDVQLAIAEIYAVENRPQRALATLQSLADSLPPDQAPPALALVEARALTALGRPRDAIRALAPAVQRPHAPAEWFAELATMQLSGGDIGAARQTIAAALSRYPQDASCQALDADLSRRETIVATVSAQQATLRQH